MLRVTVIMTFQRFPKQKPLRYNMSRYHRCHNSYWLIGNESIWNTSNSQWESYFVCFQMKGGFVSCQITAYCFVGSCKYLELDFTHRGETKISDGYRLKKKYIYLIWGRAEQRKRLSKTQRDDRTERDDPSSSWSVSHYLIRELLSGAFLWTSWKT